MNYYEDEYIPKAERMKRTEEKVFKIINDYIAKYDRSPSVQEIAKKASIPSKSTVFNYLIKLKEKGLITWEPKQQRTIKILKTVS
ncbi:helix-turn-helix domain-containing protein [Bacillus sp. JJ1773]|uniref:LexA family protein n=1 Tax=Bacillus sp. JJ1773 TaxID=3122965 RepID=UPI002FFD604F